MLRRKFISSISSIIPCSAFAISGVNPVKEKISPTLTPASLAMTWSKEKVEKFIEVFPDGCYVTEENIQTLLDHGFSIFEFISIHVPVTGKFISNGSEHWLKNGKYHRLDGPAVVTARGSQYWYKNGKFHREDGPSIILQSGTQYWYKNDRLHRLDGPAIIFADGLQVWYKEGKPYGPSVLV